MSWDRDESPISAGSGPGVAPVSIDPDRFIDRAVALAEINSGSFNVEGVARCGARLAEMVDELSPEAMTFPEVGPTITIDAEGHLVERPVGPGLRALKRPDAPFRVCLFGHLDTVFGPDHPFQEVVVDGRVLRGPGVADCKGGLVQGIEILRALETTPWGAEIGWEFLVVPDEEIGSHGSQILLETAAESADLGIGLEPALPSGGVAAARKGSLTVHAVVSGVAAHVGRSHGDGRSAIRALAGLIETVEAHNDRPGVTVNCGRVTGGGALNIVPDRAVGSFNLRVEGDDDRAWIEERFIDAAQRCPLPVQLHWTGTRPPKIRTPELVQLLTDVTDAGRGLGVEITAEDTGGCCDGNNLAAAGLPNVDSLGIAGGGIHSPEEFALVDSVATRAGVVVEVIRRAVGRAGGPGGRPR